MYSIKIGSLNVPIVDTVELSGRPIASPPEVEAAILPASKYGGQGVTCGLRENPFSPDPIRTETMLYSGVTNFHDSFILGVGMPEEIYGEAAPGWKNNAIFYKGTSPHGTSFDIITCGSYNGYTPYDDTGTYEMIAIRYRFLDGETEAEKVNSYFIVILYHEVRLDSDHIVVSDTYEVHSTFYIPLAFNNRMEDWETYYEEEYTPDEEPFDPSDDEPYEPTKDDTSDLIDIPADPVIGVTSCGFINVYKPGIGALTGLGDILFPNVASATDVMDAILKLCETLANQNLINYVIDCHVIPTTPVVGNNSNIKVGFRNTGISVPVVTSDYINVSCGSLHLAEYFGGFPDYGNISRCKLYLPFIGFVDLKPEFWQNSILRVDYKFNVIDGSFMAYVRSSSSKSQLANSVIAQYSGNACMHFPLTGVNYSNMVSGIVGAAMAASSGGGTSAILGGAYSAANAIAQGGDTQQSNGYNSTAAILGVRTPYLLIERPVPSYPANYRHDKGYPSNISTFLLNVSGFTVIEDIDLSGIPLTETELTELRSLLADGVYF